MERRLTDLNRYVRGGTGYFGLAQQFDLFDKLDGWVRRRIRMCFWKQWRRARTKVKHLVRLGVSLDMAIKHALPRKSYWRLSRTRAMRFAMPNKGSTNSQDFFRSNSSGATLLRFEEPPDADPHGRWCGEGGQR
jgi:hypothetical protein